MSVFHGVAETRETGDRSRKKGTERETRRWRGANIFTEEAT